MATGYIDNTYKSTQYLDMTNSLPTGVEGYDDKGLMFKRVGNVVTMCLSLKDVSGNTNVKTISNIPSWAIPSNNFYYSSFIISDGSAYGISTVNLKSGRIDVYFGTNKYAIGLISYVVQ